MITLKDIEDAIIALDPALCSDDPLFKSMAITLSGLYFSMDANRIAQWSGYSRKMVREHVRRLRKNRIWVGRTVHANWFDEEVGYASLLLDSLVAAGEVVKVYDDASAAETSEPASAPLIT